MSLATLANIPDPKNVASFLQFSFSDMDSHRKIAAAIYRQKGILLPLYSVDPVYFAQGPRGPELTGAWLSAEYQLHIDMNGVTRVPGNDLSTVDIQNPEQWASWIRLHWWEHQQNENILRILD